MNKEQRLLKKEEEMERSLQRYISGHPLVDVQYLFARVIRKEASELPGNYSEYWYDFAAHIEHFSK